MFTCAYGHYFLIYLISYSSKNKLGRSEDAVLQSSSVIGLSSSQHCISSISQSQHCFKTEKTVTVSLFSKWSVLIML